MRTLSVTAFVMRCDYLASWSNLQVVKYQSLVSGLWRLETNAQGNLQHVYEMHQAKSRGNLSTIHVFTLTQILTLILTQTMFFEKGLPVGFLCWNTFGAGSAVRTVRATNVI